jgi:hypothetical protein
MPGEPWCRAANSGALDPNPPQLRGAQRVSEDVARPAITLLAFDALQLAEGVVGDIDACLIADALQDLEHDPCVLVDAASRVDRRVEVTPA